MSAEKLAVVILAAGEGTRMNSRLPKVMHPLAGRPMLAHVIAAVSALDPERIVVVVGPGMEAVSAVAAPHATVTQTERLGTGHAVAMARPVLKSYLAADGQGDVLVVYGDTPLLTPGTLAEYARGPRRRRRADRGADRRSRFPAARPGSVRAGAFGPAAGRSSVSSSLPMPTRPSSVSISATPGPSWPPVRRWTFSWPASATTTPRASIT